MGKPNESQMEGTAAERLTELSGRVCYDSLNAKRSRSSADYFDHIKDVGHLSVAEHYNVPLLVGGSQDLLGDIAILVMNRPWVWLTALDHSSVRITTNLRTVLEWNRWTSALSAAMPFYPVVAATQLGAVLKDSFHGLAPRIINQPHPAEVATAREQLEIGDTMLVEPESDHEKWISLFVYGSRGLTHELVRHGDFTGMSQRSTRFCDESSGPWVLHPNIQQYLNEIDPTSSMVCSEELKEFINQARDLYQTWVKRLVPYVKQRIPTTDPYRATTARKQARGAARGLLGNSLGTEMVFSASVGQWRHIFDMRAAAAADAEIRFMACQALEACKASRYGDSFSDLTLVEASDGTGFTLSDGGAS
jgi:thymidylate synthase (FAD)